MLTRTRWSVIAVVAALCVVGCGDDDAGASGAGASSAGAGGEAGEAGSAGNAGTSGSGGSGGSSGSAGDMDAGMTCGAGSQDHDGDGVCAPACDDSTDCGHGTCDDSAGAIECICDRNFVGTACDTCTIGTTGDACDQCAENFFVDPASPSGCREDFCETMQCSDNATCNNTPSGAECSCNIGWAGTFCDVCDEGYTGAGCVTCDDGYKQGPGQVFTCVPDVCDGVVCGHGECVAQGGAGVCACDEGYALPDCTTCLTGWTLAPTGLCYLTPPTTDALVLWLDASDASTVTTDINGGVVRWDDKRPDATVDDYWYGPSNRRPTVSDDAGRKRLVFNGDDDTLRAYLDLPNPSYDIFIVTQWNAATPAQGLMGGTDMAGTGHGLWIQAKDADTVHFRHRFPFATGSGSELDGDGFDAAAGLQIVHARRRAAPFGNHIAVGEGGEALSELSPLESMPFGEPMNTWLACNGPSGNGPLDGEIAEIIIYGGVLSEANRQKVIEYLTAKWQL